MANLDNLISKIIKDSDKKSKEIVESANARAAEIIQESKREAGRERERILSEAKSEAEKAAEQLVTSRKLIIRDKSLDAKRETIDKVFETALAKLNSLPKDEYLKFLKDGLKATGLVDGELILVPGYTDKDVSNINTELGTSFKLRKNSRKISGGFVLAKEGIERNFTFDALIQYNRDALEGEIIAKLF